ncbi:MAG: hypothetical protein RIR26_1499 [Pseudomonadota bacterium]|jgi:predicted metal-binding protein
MALKPSRQSQHAHVLLCRSCGDSCKKNVGTSEEHPTQLLRKKLELAFQGGLQNSWQVRFVESSCLDLCPVGAITVRLVGAENSESKTLTWTLDPEKSLDDMITTLKDHIIQVSSGQKPRC